MNAYFDRLLGRRILYSSTAPTRKKRQTNDLTISRPRCVHCKLLSNFSSITFCTRNQILPGVLKSAVQSASAAVFIPSSFDFIRVHNYFRQHAGVSFAVLSEYADFVVIPLVLTSTLHRYSSNQDISRARQAFFQGKKSFLLISERFHFYKRSVHISTSAVTDSRFQLRTTDIKSEESVI